MIFNSAEALYSSVGKSKKITFIFCSDHGVAKMGVSTFPQATTADMVRNYLVAGGAAANAFAKFSYSDLAVVDIGVDADISNLPGLINLKISRGTKNIVEEAAMTLNEAEKSISYGKKLADIAASKGKNCFLLGEMGIGNTTAAAAMTAAYLDLPPEMVTGRGSNISDEKFKHKLKIVHRALEVNKPDRKKKLDILSKVGGYEFGAMAGVILSAYHNGCVVVLDGFNSSVAALIAKELLPESSKCLVCSHVGREIGHQEILKYLKLNPLFDLNLALGEAVGASIAARVLDILVYVFICGGIATDYEGKIPWDKQPFEKLKENLGVNSVEGLDSMEDVKNYLKKFSIELPQRRFLINERKTESINLQFDVETLNIPFKYLNSVRVMSLKKKIWNLTDRTFDFYLKTMPPLNVRAMRECRKILDNSTKPFESLGYLEDIAIQFAGITGEAKPPNKLCHGGLAIANINSCPSIYDKLSIPLKKGFYKDACSQFNTVGQIFRMKLFLGAVRPQGNINLAFDFGRTIAEEITFNTSIIAITDLSSPWVEQIKKIFSTALLTSKKELRRKPEEFIKYVPRNYKCMVSAIAGAIIAAAHNSALVVVDTGAIDIIARYLEEICPSIRPFILHSDKLIKFVNNMKDKVPESLDGEAAFVTVEIVEAALTAINEMKSFQETGVTGAI